MANIRNFEFWGLCSHIFAPINVKFGKGERTCSPLPRAKFDVYRGNALRGEKPIFGPLSKNNTGMAARRHAGNKVGYAYHFKSVRMLLTENHQN